MGRLPRSYKPTYKVRQMKMLLPRPLKVEHEFTDDRLTGFGGCSALASTARRMWEFLSKVSESDVNGLLGAARKVAKRIAPAVIKHEVAERSYVPVFVDGT